MSKSLYDRLGGDAAIAAALDAFYGRVLDDPDVSHYFDGIDIERLKDRQRDFFAMAFGGPDRYEGRDLRTAHDLPRRRGLDEDGYGVFMGHFEQTLIDLGVGRSEIDEVMAIAHTGKDDVLGR